MNIAEKIEALKQDSHLEKVRKQAEELKKQAETQGGVKLNLQAEYQGYDISKKFAPVARPSLFKARLG